MRFLYIAPLPIDFNNLDGVPKKILAHVKTLATQYEVDLLYYFNGRVMLYRYGEKCGKEMCFGKSKLHVLKYAKRHLKENLLYKGVYVRYPKSDFIFIDLLKYLKKRAIPVVVEIPTFPYDMEGFETLKGRLINYLDRYYRKKLYKYVDRIVTFSSDEKIFGVPTIRTVNGTDFDMVVYDDQELDLKREIRLIAVSAMFRVHGFERLIEGLHRYYASGGQRFIRLDLVGEGSECSKYQALTAKYGLQNNVVFHGKVFGTRLTMLYKGCAIGINSLAIHRQGLKAESTLKTREYAAYGLPMLSSSYIDALDQAGNERYVMRISSDETPVDINALIDFVDKIYVTDIKKLRKEIRENAYKISDISVTMKPILNFFDSKKIN